MPWIAYRRLVDAAWSIVKTPVGGGEAVRLDEATAGGGTTAWSPDGQWIAHERPEGMHLVPAAGGTVPVLAGRRSNAFRFSRDATRLFVVRRGDRRQWELAIWDVAAGQEVRVVPLPAAPTVDLQMLAMTPDDSRLIVSAVTNRADIWLLEEFEAQPSWLLGLAAALIAIRAGTPGEGGPPASNRLLARESARDIEDRKENLSQTLDRV